MQRSWTRDYYRDTQWPSKLAEKNDLPLEHMLKRSELFQLDSPVNLLESNCNSLFFKQAGALSIYRYDSVIEEEFCVKDFAHAHRLCQWLSGTEKENIILSALIPKGYYIKHNPRRSREEEPLSSTRVASASN